MRAIERISDDDVKKYAGQWVAVKSGRVLFAAGDPRDVANWLKENRLAADLVYRLPAPGEPTNWVY